MLPYMLWFTMLIMGNLLILSLENLLLWTLKLILGSICVDVVLTPSQMQTVAPTLK